MDAMTWHRLLTAGTKQAAFGAEQVLLPLTHAPVLIPFHPKHKFCTPKTFAPREITCPQFSISLPSLPTPNDTSLDECLNDVCLQFKVEEERLTIESGTSRSEARRIQSLS